MTKSLQVSQPSSLLFKKVKFDLKPIFKGITKAITHAATLKVEELGNDAAEVLGGFGLDNTPDELAFLLIKRSLSDAFIELAKDSISHFQITDIKGDLTSKLQADLAGLHITLDKSFLDSPGQQPFISEIIPIYTQWLIDMGVKPHSAAIISQRLPSYFVFSLTTEWRKNSTQYKLLIDSLQTPFTKAAEREWDWESYYAMLNRRTQENVFDEPFSLAQIYIPLNAYYVETSGKKAGAEQFERREKKIVVDIAKDLQSWLLSGKVDDAIRVVSGGPGSGKSSFTKIFCAELAQKRIAKPIYIPLHLIDPTKDVSDEVAKFVRDEGYLRFNPLDQDNKQEKIFLVFDGLDELANQGKVAAQVAKDFVLAVEKMVERRNMGPLPLKVLISGREMVIQENQSEFRRPKQILTILPYYVDSHDRREFDDPLGLLKSDTRNDWWKRYGALSGHGFEEGLPENLQRREIDELTAQPLLNYLVALSFTRGKIDFGKKLNLNTIYADLVTAVYERGYEKGRTFRPIKHISCQDFVRVLEEIGMAAWHASDGRSTSVNEILAHCRESGLEKLVQSFQEGAQAGVTKLLAAFFFRKSGEHASGDPTFVFTHKSFGEYLTAARVVRGMERIVTQLMRRDANTDDGFDLVDALVHWAKIAGPAQTTPHIRRFLVDEIRQRPSEQIKVWHQKFSFLLEYVVDRGMPMEKVGALTFLDAMRQNSNASEALVLALNGCAVSIEKRITLRLASLNSFGTFLRKIVPQRLGPASPILFEGLSYFDFSGQRLDMADFYGANLVKTVWKRAELNFANFGSSDLREANFSQAALNWSSFSNAKLIKAKMIRARCDESDFRRAVLIETNFMNADLRRSNFLRADINKAVFAGAKVIGVKIRREEIAHGDFSGVANTHLMKVREGAPDKEDDDFRADDEEKISEIEDISSAGEEPND